MKKASVIILKIISTAAALFASYYALIIKSMSAKKECVFLFEKLRLLYNMKHIRKRTSLYLCFFCRQFFPVLQIVVFTYLHYT